MSDEIGMLIEALKKQEQEVSEKIENLIEQRKYLRKVIALKTVTKKIKDMERRDYEKKIV